jgi:hypothetical protein
MKAKLSSFEPSDSEALKTMLISSSQPPSASSSPMSLSSLLMDLDYLKSSDLSKAWICTCKTIAGAFKLNYHLPSHLNHHPNHHHVNAEVAHTEDDIPSISNRSSAVLLVVLRSFFPNS